MDEVALWVSLCHIPSNATEERRLILALGYKNYSGRLVVKITVEKLEKLLTTTSPHQKQSKRGAFRSLCPCVVLYLDHTVIQSLLAYHGLSQTRERQSTDGHAQVSPQYD